MGTTGAMVGIGLITLLVSTSVLATSPPADDCVKPTPPSCPKNEIYRCQNTCPPDFCITLYAAFDCIANQTCVSGCYCKSGYLRIGRNGPCVPRDQCPPLECVDDSNARRGCGDKCGKTCADYNTNPICPKKPCKNDGCDCKEGYIHDTNQDKCVLPMDCTKPCKSHERWSPCLMGECVAKICEDLGKPLSCPANAMDPCPGGCICDYGYVKAKNGSCIDAKTCPSCGGDPNAQTGCGNPCGKTCALLNVNQTGIICPQYCEENGCDCKKGYFLDTDSKPPRCVLAKDCPKPCGKNEEYYCGPSCPDSEASCSNPNPVTCINKRCELKCFCKKGYVRDAKNGNVCIPVDKCHITTTVSPPTTLAPPKCKTNEHWIDCYDGQCEPKTCDELITPAPCPRLIPPCAGGCICDNGYVRDSNGVCIKKEDCPKSCTKEHEKYIDCYAGQCLPKSCDDIGRSISCPRPRGPCPGGCICEEGYLRDVNGNCIKIEDCPPKPCRGNETWVTPCNALCPTRRCPRDDKPPPPCVELLPCYPGCQCKLNYLRNTRGECILAPDCPPVNCTRQNEEWNSCPSACLAESCDAVNNQPTTCNTLIWNCSPRCVCKKGYFRNKDGLCIPASECPLYCKDPNASWRKCKDICPGTCENPNPICISKSVCSPGCQCKKDYVLDKPGSGGKCIKIDQCPAKNCTGQNEQYTDCIEGKCKPTTCKEVVKMPYCPSSSDCSGGCACNSGFVRSDNGTCIAISDCPEAGNCTDPNQAWSQCAVNCANAYCPKDDQPQPLCFLPVGLCHPGCKCKTNYRISKDNKCIPARDCPPVTCTRPNEEYNSCPGDRISSCALLGTAPAQSPGTGAKICYPGCICKKGFYTNDNSTCVPECECPPNNSSD